MIDQSSPWEVVRAGSADKEKEAPQSMVELRNSAESAKESSKEDKASSCRENPDVKTRNKFQKKAKSRG